MTVVTSASASGYAGARSPSASVSDLSEDEEGEYDNILHSRSGKEVRLLFSKSKVYVHPTPSSKDNQAGFVALIQQRAPKRDESTAPDPESPQSPRPRPNAASYLLAWLPENTLGKDAEAYTKVELADSGSPLRQRPRVPLPPTTTTLPGDTIGTYAFAIPVSEIYSLLIRPPNLGWWFGSLVINTRSGSSFPALFFHDDECQSTILQRKKRAKDSFDPFDEAGATFWGGDEVLRWLKKYVDVEKSGADPSVYLIEPSAEDKLGFSHVAARTPQRNDHGTVSGVITGGGTNASFDRDAGMDPVTKALKQARWTFLEKMSQVTNFTKRTAQDIVESSRVPPRVKRLMKSPELQTLQEEYDSARVYLARWAMGIAEQGEKERQQRILTAQDVLDLEDTGVGEFELLDIEMNKLVLEEKRQPVTITEWNGFFDRDDGYLRVTIDEVKERILLGGLDPSDGSRREAWLFLLGVYSWESSGKERKEVMSQKRDEYVRLKRAWWDRMVDGSMGRDNGEWWKEQRGRIEKDVHRTDRHIHLFEGEDIPHPDPDSPFAEVGTNVHMEQMKDLLLTYNEYNKDLGYVQGMSDLLAPIYAVEQDDAVAFWAFVGFMERMERNFLRDQSGMRKQLLTLDHLVQLMDPQLYLHLQSADSTNFFFFFRMLLVWYKREFPWHDILRLWEALWTDYYSSNFHLFIALAILEKHRSVIMEHLKRFDEVLKYVNELSNTIDLQSTLIRAEAMFRRFQRTVEAIDKKNHFPAAPVRQRKPHSSDTDASSPQASAQASGSDQATSSAVEGSQHTETVQAELEKDTRVISPELRSLLSRKVEKMEGSDILAHGGGVPS